ncbi:MAG: hypothetical protein ACXU86_20520 [Archangium sp.]
MHELLDEDLHELLDEDLPRIARLERLPPPRAGSALAGLDGIAREPGGSPARHDAGQEASDQESTEGPEGVSVGSPHDRWSCAAPQHLGALR